MATAPSSQSPSLRAGVRGRWPDRMLERLKLKRDLAAALLAALGGLLLVALVLRSSDLRLYWEYGSMLTGGAYTPGYSDWVQQRVGDLRPIDGAFRNALSPYTDFTCEYPPGILLMFAALYWLFPNIAVFSAAYAVLAAAMAALAIGYVFSAGMNDKPVGSHAWFTAGALVAWIYLAGSLIVTRFDIFTLPLVLAAFASMRHKRFALAGVLLGAGAAIKLWPALLVLPFAIYALGPAWRLGSTRLTDRRLLRGLSLIACAAVTFAIPHLIMIAAFGTSPADSLGYLRYMADRPAQIESAAGNLSVFLTALLGGVPETLFSYGSHNVMAPQWVLTGAQVLLVLGYLAILLLALSLARRPASPSGIGASSSTLACIGGAVVVLVLLTSKVFSGEYLIWLMPFVFLCGRRRDIVLYCAALALLKGLYSRYDLVTSTQLTGSLLVFAKNFLVAGLGVSMLAGRLTRGRYWQQIRTAAV